MNHLIKFSDPVFTNLISNNMDKRVYTLKKMKEIFLKINTGMQINGVEELNAKHVAGVTHSSSIFACILPSIQNNFRYLCKFVFFNLCKFGLDMQLCIANESLCLLCCSLMPQKLFTHIFQGI